MSLSPAVGSRASLAPANLFTEHLVHESSGALGFKVLEYLDRDDLGVVAGVCKVWAEFYKEIKRDLREKLYKNLIFTQLLYGAEFKHLPEDKIGYNWEQTYQSYQKSHPTC